ncbi:MAG: hypothetical protein KDA64_01250 [Rhodospirillaceae bacterium]|nr:hypothetical protein [Rhodospirillaceae bacterium]
MSEGSNTSVLPVSNVPQPPRSGDSLFPDLAEFQPHITEGGGCVTDREITAEQFIAFRTAMMVTGLTCRRAYNADEDVFGTYQQFTVDNAQRLRETQNLIGAYLARYRPGNSSRLFDTYQTELANAEALLVTSVSASRYCQAQRERFYRLAEASPDELERILDLAVERYRDTYELCS